MKRKNRDGTTALSAITFVPSDVSDDDDDTDVKIKLIEKQLEQLKNGIHPGEQSEFCSVTFTEYLKAKHQVDSWLSDEKRRARIVYDNKLEKRRIQDHLIALCEDVRRRLDQDKKNIELTPSGDILELKPAVTRKLRRRAGNATDISFSSTSNVSYWSDLLLCNSNWPLSISTNQPNQHQQASASSPTSLPKIVGTDDTEAEQNQPSSSVTAATGVPTVPQTSLVASSQKSKLNLFGSLGINLFDQGLISNLLTSFNTAVGGHQRPLSPNTAASVDPAACLLASTSGTVQAVAAASIPQTGQPNKKRRQINTPPASQLSLMLPENEIYTDLTYIHRVCGKIGSGGTVGSRRQTHLHNTNQPSPSSAYAVGGSPPHNRPSGNSPLGYRSTYDSPASPPFGSPTHESTRPSGNVQSGTGNNMVSVWTDDGRLYYKSKCYQTGNSVILEGREGPNHRCNGTIIFIAAHEISIQRHTDHCVHRVTVQQLKQGRYSLSPYNAPGTTTNSSSSSKNDKN